MGGDAILDRPFVIVTPDWELVQIHELKMMHVYLTFDWFKRNYICKDHPGECRRNSSVDVSDSDSSN